MLIVGLVALFVWELVKSGYYRLAAMFTIALLTLIYRRGCR